jgi:hypothetical protein
MGELFEKTILEDGRFEIPCKRHLGLLAFRFKVRVHTIDYRFAYEIK